MPTCPCQVLAPRFMMRLRGLALLLLFLPGDARRRIRIDDSRDHAQQVSAEARDALIPGGLWASVSRRVGPQAGALREGSKHYGRRVGQIEPPSKMVGVREPWFRSGPRRAEVALQVASSPKPAIVEPSADLGPTEMVDLVCKALQDNDSPTLDAGLTTLFRFLTPQGRAAIAPPQAKGGRQGGVELDAFLTEASHPFLVLIGCDEFIVSEATVINATATRGALGTVKLEVRARPDGERLSNSLSSSVANREADTNSTVTRRFLLSLEQQRRPPLTGCWLLKEPLALERSAFQMLNEGSTELW